MTGLTASIILSAKAESLPAKFRKKTRMLAHHVCSAYSVGSSSHSNETGSKRYQTGREDAKLPLMQVTWCLHRELWGLYTKSILTN